eukprot:TRINITY_DN3082_c0_g2_i1.p1 TRINITY_DN3082_c0_g2~~TRINITY_DN3082_c0_g2_i1.p1  ORF type:complete len:536 (-),score=99.20 TRINITY_DN3082_c0_g2_i1:91-1698(-)
MELDPSPGPLSCCPAHLQLAASLPPSVAIPKLVHLKKAETSIGRDKNQVDVFLDSTRAPRMISRVHAHVMHLVDASWKIRDNHSVNGLFVNSIKVHEAALKDGDLLTFGGGGNMAFGQRKDQQETSEFIYRFLINPEFAEDTPSSGRKRHRDDMTDGDGEDESKQKKIKIEDHQSTVAVFEDELRRKEEEAALLKRRLMELESKDAEFQRRQEEIEKQEKMMFEKIEEARKERERIASTAKANEEALIAQMKAKEETLKEQAKLLEEKLQNEKRTFDEEIQLMRRKLDEHEKADLSDRTLLKQLQEQLKNAREELEKSSTEYIERSSFEEEFTCSICQELLLDARTLECAHSFCSSCLDDWRKQKSECPICRKKIDKPPVRALNIDSIVSKLVTKLPQDDKAEWERRMDVRSQKQQVEKLQEMIKTARQRNLRFLDIKTQWKDVEKATFKDGVSRYTGEAKKMYCETIGLTPQWINSATPAALVLACSNIGLSIHGANLRETLLNYINSVPASRSALQPAAAPVGPPQRNVIDLT